MKAFENMKRRDFTLALCAVPLAASVRAQGVASSTARRGAIAAAVLNGVFTRDTAPDATSRAILTLPFGRLYGGPKVTGDKNAAIHAAFPQIIEQNFAQLDALHMEALVNTLSDQELSDLAQLYANATSDISAPKRLLNVMSHRLSAQHLGRISRHFGFADVYEAINTQAPAKRNDFIAASHPNYRGPAVGERRFGPDGSFAPQLSGKLKTTAYRPYVDRPQRMQPVGFGQFLNYTPYEIYLDFRTAPIGALGVTGALWETSVVLSSTLLTAYGTGYAIGQYVVAPLIETYAPSLYNSIGSVVNSVVNTLSSSWGISTTAQGQAQRATAPVFQSTGLQIDSFSCLGGDYGAASSWEALSGGGGGCRNYCYPKAAY